MARTWRSAACTVRLHVRGLGVQQTVEAILDVVAHLLRLELEQRAVGTGQVEQRRDVLAALDVHHGPTAALVAGGVDLARGQSATEGPRPRRVAKHKLDVRSGPRERQRAAAQDHAPEEGAVVAGRRLGPAPCLAPRARDQRQVVTRPRSPVGGLRNRPTGAQPDRDPRGGWVQGADRIVGEPESCDLGLAAALPGGLDTGQLPLHVAGGPHARVSWPWPPDAGCAGAGGRVGLPGAGGAGSRPACRGRGDGRSDRR